MDNNAQQSAQPMIHPAGTDDPVAQQNNNNQQPGVATSINQVQQGSDVKQEVPDKKTQQVSISGHPEQGAVATIEMDEDDDDKDDRIQAVRQETAKKETPIPVVQMAHPEVLIQKELSQAGVSPGQDAVKKEIPEEPEQIGDVLPPAQNQTAVQLGDPTLTMTYGEAQLAAKKERSISKGISWIVRLIIREWKKRLSSKPDEKEVKLSN